MYFAETETALSPIASPPSRQRLDAGRMYVMNDLVRLLDLTESTINRLIAAGRFPRGIKLTRQSAPAWSELTIQCVLHLAPMMEPHATRDEAD